MSRLSTPLEALALAGVMSFLVACDEGSTSPVPGPGTTDTTSSTHSQNDALVRAAPLPIQPSWIVVKMIAPVGWPVGTAWYALEIDSGFTYQVTLKDTAFTSPSLELYDADSSLLRRAAAVAGTSNPNLIRVQFEAVRTERIFVVVRGNVGARLELSIEVLPGLDALPDAYEAVEGSTESKGGPALWGDSVWINRTLHRTSGGTMESGDPFRLVVDSGNLYTIHVLARGNCPTIAFSTEGDPPIDTLWTHMGSKNSMVATLTFAAYRSGTIPFVVAPSGPEFKPVHYRVAATAREGIPALIYPDPYESDNSPEIASFLIPDGREQIRTLHRDNGVSDTDQILLINPTDSIQVLELHDSLQAIAVDGFAFDGSPVALADSLSGTVRTFLVSSSGGAPIRVRLTNRLPIAMGYRILLRAP